MKEIETFSIDQFNFVSREYDFDHGWPLLLKIFKICGRSVLTFVVEGMDGLIKEALGGTISQDQMKSMTVMEILNKIDREKMGDAFGAFLDRLEPESFVKLTEDILQNTWIVDADKNRQPINCNLHFKGKYGIVLKLLRKVLVLQYQDSFQGLLSGLTEPSKSVAKPVVARVVAR